MSIDSFKCSCCHNTLIAPVTISCGHTFCYSDLTRVTNSKCPLCRTSFNKSTMHTNILMEEIIMSMTPDYEKLKEQSQIDNKMSIVDNMYKKSIRYKNNKTAIKLCITEPMPIDKVISKHSDIPEDEIKYIIDQSIYLRSFEATNGIRYVFNISYKFHDNELAFIRSNRGILTPQIVICIMDSDSHGNDMEYFHAYYGSPPTNSMFHKNRPDHFLQTLNEKDLLPLNGSDSDDSDSDDSDFSIDLNDFDVHDVDYVFRVP